MTPARAYLRHVGIAIVAALAAVLLLAACNSSNSGESGSGGAAGDKEQAALDFSQCMRDNGVPTFPDPVAKSDGTFSFERPQGVPRSALDDALESCQSEARAAGFASLSEADDPETQDQLLEFSRCMRANGVPDFPDPKPNGSGSLESIFGGVDVESPRVQEALQSCDSILSQLGAPFGSG